MWSVCVAWETLMGEGLPSICELELCFAYINININMRGHQIWGIIPTHQV